MDGTHGKGYNSGSGRQKLSEKESPMRKGRHQVGKSQMPLLSFERHLPLAIHAFSAYELGMKNSTYRIIVAAISADDTITSDQRDAALSILRERNTNTTPLPLLLTQAQAGRLLGVSRITIYRLVQDGKLHPTKIREALRYQRAEIERFAGLTT